MMSDDALARKGVHFDMVSDACERRAIPRNDSRCVACFIRFVDCRIIVHVQDVTSGNRSAPAQTGFKVAIPDFQSIMLPLLQQTADGEIHTARELKERLADSFRLTSEEGQQMLPSGQQTTFHNRVSWAKTYLERAGLLESVRRGHFKISARGREVLASSIDHIDNELLRQYPEFVVFRTRGGSDDGGDGTAGGLTNASDSQTPEEALQAAYTRIRNDIAVELLEQIKLMSSTFFEKLVLDLMVSMGYGGMHDTPASLTAAGADEGIDGVINEDQLGLDIVYLQAKRWENQVGRPEIQRFVGALHGKRARKGVFLTTSAFSREARDYVATIDPRRSS